MPVSKYLSFLLCAALMAFLSACATLPQANTVAKKVVLADSNFTAVVAEINRMHDVGLLTDEQVLDLNPIIQTGVQAREAAYAALEANHPDTALEYVNILRNVLIQLRYVIQEEPNAG